MQQFFESRGGLTLMLFVGLFLSTSAVLAIGPANERAYALMTNLVGNFSGALLVYVQQNQGVKPPTA